MNSLVSPTKVITNDDIINPIPTTAASNIELPKKIPISVVPVPIMETKSVEASVELALDNAVFDDNEIEPNSDSVKERLELEVNLEGKQEPVANLSVDTMLDDDSLSPLSGVVNEPMECSSSIASQVSPREEEAIKVVADDVLMESVNEVHVSMHLYVSGIPLPFRFLRFLF